MADALAIRSLGVAPDEIMMVASHKYALVAAWALEFRTASSRGRWNLAQERRSIPRRIRLLTAT